jgi:hypothetical protein
MVLMSTGRILNSATCCNLACHQGYQVCAELLITNKADTDSKDLDQKTPADYAQQCQAQDMYERDL